MTNITLDSLPAKTGTISDAGIVHYRESGVDKKMTVADFLTKISEGYSVDINTFLNVANKEEARAALDITNAAVLIANITTNITITNSVYTKVLYNSAPLNFGNWFNTSTSIWTPQKAGYYLVNQTLEAYDGNGTTEYFHSQIEKNGSEIAYYNANNSNAVNDVSTAVSKIIYMNGTTDYIEFYTQGTRTAGSNFTLMSTTSRTFCQATFLGN